MFRGLTLEERLVDDALVGLGDDHAGRTGGLGGRKLEVCTKSIAHREQQILMALTAIVFALSPTAAA